MPDDRGADAPATGPCRSEDLIDTARYPLCRRGTDAYGALVARTKADLRAGNCARLAAFLRPGALAELRGEAREAAAGATYTEGNFNPYFSDAPADCLADHPLRRVARRVHGMVRGDSFAPAGPIWVLFKNAQLCDFVADCLGLERLYTYRDPYGCVNVNVQPASCEFAWHFDHNDYTVSILLQEAEEGGAFEYVPNLRSAADERYGEVKAVLDGDRRQVQSLDLRPGDLQLFKGRHTLHRVTAPAGDRSRLSLLLGYVPDPERIATPAYAERLWGEVHPLQREAAARTAVSDGG